MAQNSQLLKQQALELDKQALWSEACGLAFQAALLAESLVERIENLTFGSQMLINIGQTTAAKHLPLSIINACAKQDNDEIRKTCLRTYYHLGWAYSNLGDYDKARACLKKALEREDIKWSAKHHLAKVDLEVGIINNNPALVEKSFREFSEHNEHFGGNLAHGLRLMARAKGALYVLTDDEKIKQQSKKLYQRTREVFAQEKNIYWPSELAIEEKILLGEKDPMTLLGFQKFLRSRREKMHADFKEITAEQRLKYMEKMLKEFEAKNL
ncbi:hypothetical protein B5M47_02725 [candidate division CPR3 bacterium 4484_211]|uniref:Uncharacterized protein n=1 Tax=candidate division CPR3 bacterium 4484_211 TaxID=1968527 RepID=A0A1W9NXX6_UNCC3|nr:MAG: hypothetical protein B5M47_02725 [candidate division CPR3 bacterium 4484_211]